MSDMEEPNILAWVGEEPWQFVPSECSTPFLLGFVTGFYDSMNEGNNELVAKEREMAREELIKRGVTIVVGASPT